MSLYILNGLRSPCAAVRSGGFSAAAPEATEGQPATSQGQTPPNAAGLSPFKLSQQLLDGLFSQQPLLAEAELLSLGCVGQVGPQGANLAQTLCASRPYLAQAFGQTTNAFCASGLAALGNAAGYLQLQSAAAIAIAGGTECLSQVGMFADNGAWFKDKEVRAATNYINMGVAADLLAHLRGFSRQELDAYACRSQERAAAAEGPLSGIICPITSATGTVFSQDNAVRPGATLASLARLQPGFQPNQEEAARLATLLPPGAQVAAHHHAGNAPALVDASALLVMANEAAVHKFGLTPQARLLGITGGSAEPLVMLTGHTAASKALLRRHHLTPADCGVIEVNESFSSSVLAFCQDLAVASERVNLWGGAIARGHPLGATGIMLVQHAIAQLRVLGQRYGLIAIPGGAGLGMAALIENLATY